MGVNFEDNLSSHNTLEVLEFWKTHLKNFVAPQFVPANLTDIIQVIDRHIGIIYKRAVYRAVRVELMKRLREARDAAGCADGITIKAMTPKEKRVLITWAVGDCHARLTHHLCKTYERAFIATATWMPVYHLLQSVVTFDSESNNATTVAAIGPSVIPEDYQVLLQHLKNYIYSERCSKDKVIAAYTAEEVAKQRARIKKLSQEDVWRILVTIRRVF